MKLADFDFVLPHERIAKYPPTNRSACKLLCLNKNNNTLQHKQFTDLLDFVNTGDLLVFNNTKVIPARMFGHKKTGGKLEILLERILSDKQFLAHLKVSHAPAIGSFIYLGTDLTTTPIKVKVIEQQDMLFILEVVPTADYADINLLAMFDRLGHIPLPPYFEREDEAIDRIAYQTVYSEKLGAVAAPTAGLHFTTELLAQLQAKGVNIAYLTLHVGSGTFLPVRSEDISQHKMHSEYLAIDQHVVTKILATKQKNKRVIAIGTTSVRALETIGKIAEEQHTELQAYQGYTDIFIYPGKQFRIIDAMITNFHQPKSSLVMLVSAFAGIDNIKTAYQTAIANNYRFLSYGDAMLIY